MDKITKKRGRKPIKDKKLPVWIMINKSIIEKHGGMDNMKKSIHQFLENN